MSKIVDRIEREVGIPGLASALADRVDPTDLQSLLLEVYRRRASDRGAAAVLADYTANRFVHPCGLSPEQLAVWDGLVVAQLPEAFDRIELSPVAPLGTASILADVSQDWAVTTARNTEVVSDATNVLALEIAVRRRLLLRADPKSVAPVHLATSHRHLRPQQFDHPDFRAHFRLFAMASGCRDLGAHRFELGCLATHIGVYLRALKVMTGLSHIRVTVSEFGALGASVDDDVFEPLRRQGLDVEYVRDRERTRGRQYYRDVCFSIDRVAGSTEMVNLADGGSAGWTERLLSNGKERLVVSGIGSEMVCRGMADRAGGSG